MNEQLFKAGGSYSNEELVCQHCMCVMHERLRFKCKRGTQWISVHIVWRVRVIKGELVSLRQ